MSLSDPVVQRFLATKHVVVLATTQATGAPLAMPMWFLHDPDVITMLSIENTQKIRNLRRDARVCMVAEASSEAGSEGRGVTVHGRVEFLADSPERRVLVDRFHEKYPELMKFWGARPLPVTRVMFRIIPAHVNRWGLD